MRNFDETMAKLEEKKRIKFVSKWKMWALIGSRGGFGVCDQSIVVCVFPIRFCILRFVCLSLFDPPSSHPTHSCHCVQTQWRCRVGTEEKCVRSHLQASDLFLLLSWDMISLFRFSERKSRHSASFSNLTLHIQMRPIIISMLQLHIYICLKPVELTQS